MRHDYRRRESRFDEGHPSQVNVGIYGGTFDPPTNAHVMVAAHIASQPWVDELLVIPSMPAYKKNVSPWESRLALARLAFRFIPKTTVSPIEMYEKLQYTCDTLKLLKRLRPKKTQFYLFIGSDWNIARFKNFKYIQKVCQVIIVRRNHDLVYGEQSVDAPASEISSTYVRERLKTGLYVDGMIPESVLNFIQREKLYGVR